MEFDLWKYRGDVRAMQKLREERLEEEQIKKSQIESRQTRNSQTKKLVMAAMFASLICVATLILRIPSPFKGYIHLGDGIVLLAGWLLPPAYSFLASGIGAALADMLSGYAVYIPVTFFVKGIMAQITYFGALLFCKKWSATSSWIISGTLAVIVMVLGYFAFEWILYGQAAILNIPMNTVQGVAGIATGVALVKALKKQNRFK